MPRSPISLPGEYNASGSGIFLPKGETLHPKKLSKLKNWLSYDRNNKLIEEVALPWLHDLKQTGLTFLLETDLERKIRNCNPVKTEDHKLNNANLAYIKRYLIDRYFNRYRQHLNLFGLRISAKQGVKNANMPTLAEQIDCPHCGERIFLASGDTPRIPPGSETKTRTKKAGNQ